ncbi:MAG TPA: NAD(P)-dependent glycerol-3-phosphate dehydrogenase, partial [Candidatus Tenderia electrophaga]|nr:NAD(P)-dependent glycerol-3-phosphate dehydrogenase [Candidatus Tenderia electrophaga]
MTAIPQVDTTVIGAGAWGTALATLLAGNGQPVCLWGRNGHQLQEMASGRINDQYLPGVVLSEALRFESDLSVAVAAAQDLLLVVPSHAFRQTLESIKPYVSESSRLIWASKGFEPGSGRLLHQVAEGVLGTARPMAVITGPTFALEVAKGLPTALTVASVNPSFAADIAARLHNNTFRAYTSVDVPGVEVGGAVKNILAIAAGISDGLGYGANARAALITRGLTEVMRLGEALGGCKETLMGLAGLGDLLLTCTDDQSRNRRFGLALGRGLSISDARASINQVVEGIDAAREAHGLA